MNPGKGFKRPDAAELRIKRGEASLTVPVFKPKTCKACRAKFTPSKKLQAVCDHRCAEALIEQRRQKEIARRMREDRISTRAALEAMKPHKYWLQFAQDAVNAYVRGRDAGLPCISCGKPDTGARDAGHFFSVGARRELRYDLDNIHAQCVRCNQHLHGNATFYRIGLVARIGEARVARLEGPHPQLKLTIPDLQALRDEYRAKLKALPSIRPVDADVEALT
jgi:hypothetical protein